MKTQLKNFTMALSIIFAAASGAVAQEDHHATKVMVQSHGIDMLGRNLEGSNVPGIVEGSLYDAIECKNLYPDLDYSKLLQATDRLANESNDPALAYKAHLVGMYLSHSSEIQVTPISGAEYHEYLFKQIADQLESKFLALQNG